MDTLQHRANRTNHSSPHMLHHQSADKTFHILFTRTLQLINNNPTLVTKSIGLVTDGCSTPLGVIHILNDYSLLGIFG